MEVAIFCENQNEVFAPSDIDYGVIFPKTESWSDIDER